MAVCLAAGLVHAAKAALAKGCELVKVLHTHLDEVARKMSECASFVSNNEHSSVAIGTRMGWIRGGAFSRNAV